MIVVVALVLNEQVSAFVSRHNYLCEHVDSGIGVAPIGVDFTDNDIFEGAGVETAEAVRMVGIGTVCEVLYFVGAN